MNAGRTERQKLPVWPAIVFSTIACAVAVTGSLMRPVWHDELYTLWLARLPLTDLVSALRVDSGPPLHYLICHALYVLIGWHEGSGLGTFLVRLPSVLAFAAMPWVLWRWARGHGERFFWAALLTMVWLPMLYFATEARAYALLALVNAVLWLLGPDLIKSGGVRIVLFSVVAAALPMLHYAGIVSFCFLPALALFIPRSRWRSCAAALGAAAVPLLAWSPIVLGAPGDSMRWVNTSAGPGRPGIASIEVLSPAGPFPALFAAPSTPVPIGVSVGALTLMIAVAGFGAWKILGAPDADPEKRPVVLRMVIGLLPAIVLGGFALGGLSVYFAGRTESMVWAVSASLAAASSLAVPRSARRAGLAPYAVLGLLTVCWWISDLPSQPDAIGVEVGRELAGVLAPHDRVVVVGLWQLEVRHGLAEEELHRSGRSQLVAVVETLPRSQAGHPGWLDLEAAASRGLIEEARVYERDVRLQNGRIWLVWSPSLPLEQSLFPAFAGWRRNRALDSPILAVELLSPPEPGG